MVFFEPAEDPDVGKGERAAAAERDTDAAAAKGCGGSDERSTCCDRGPGGLRQVRTGRNDAVLRGRALWRGGIGRLRAQQRRDEQNRDNEAAEKAGAVGQRARHPGFGE